MYRAIATRGPRTFWRKFREDQPKTPCCRFALLIRLTSAWSLKRYVLSQKLVLLISWYCLLWEWMRIAITNTISGRMLTRLTNFWDRRLGENGGRRHNGTRLNRSEE